MDRTRGSGSRPTYRSYRAPARRRPRYLLRRLLALAVFLAVVAAAAALAMALRGGGPDKSSPGSGSGGSSGSGAPARPATTPASPRSSPVTSPSASPSRPVIEIGWAGDTTPGSRYGLPPNEGRALFAALRPYLRKPDLMIINLEGTYSSGGVSKCGDLDASNCYAFQAPPSYAGALAWAGIDLVSLANNHSHDYLQSGLDQTIAALENTGIAYSGLPDQITSLKVRGVRVAVLAFSPYPWNNDLNDIPAARRLVRRAAREADVLVVLMHAGAEGADKIHTPRGTEVAFGENRGDSRAFAHAVIDEGADLVLGSGPHVIRGIERYKDRLIAYSLGNFGGWGNFGLGGNLSLSGLLTVRVGADGSIRGGRWLSLYLDRPGVPRVDATNAAARLVRQLSAVDFSSTYRLDDQGRFGR